MFSITSRKQIIKSKNNVWFCALCGFTVSLFYLDFEEYKNNICIWNCATAVAFSTFKCKTEISQLWKVEKFMGKSAQKRFK